MILFYLLAPPSSIIKVTNAISLDPLKTLTDENFDDVQGEMFALFGQQGTVINGFIVRPHQAAIGGILFKYFIVCFQNDYNLIIMLSS